MRTAPDLPDNGQTVRTTTVRQVLPADPAAFERKTPEFWSYLQSLKPEDWDKHILYIYRRFDTGPSQPLEKCSVYFVMPDGTKVPLNNQEELEIALAQTYGGGSYRVWIKKGQERVTEGRITIDGPPKNTQPGILRNAESSSQPSGQPGSVSNDVATTAMHLVANNPGEGMRIGMQVLQGAADVVSRFAAAPPNSSTMDELLKQAMVVMMQRAMNPPDPLDLITKLLPLLKNGTSDSGGTSPLVDRILETGLERVLNPAPSGPVSSAGAELVRQLPQVAGYVTEAIREWRLGSEAQLHTAQVMATNPNRTLPPGTPGNGTVPAPGAAPVRQITQATQVVPPPAATPQPVPGEPSIEFIEQKIVDILKKAISADEAADEVLAFLDLMAPPLIEQLAVCTEAQLVQLFQTRPVLRQYHDLARLQEFVRAFLKYSKEAEEPPAPAGAVKPN